ncbi:MULTISPECIES: GNAT family N-acetyltransferase [Brevibacillus]|jgi:ribosomal protein S18 acetylase RimI-like enzyme|uniref:GNAT family N-acetyltransferase n=1 Tax=Brevibacillus TaxID=55080 RepID=UPI000EDCDFAC|nr:MULTISPECIES: GNAT family N-acetyltransferase [Brevibacillus]MDH6353586.1 ribosomal protein S18 acetylase RimI-like enzyme [Brevibacillus sp. 1238]MDR4999841.1 GNAT family N-acetyltransferase [Brevibacillus parabrevis]HBZ82368.1 GNAT family N-acetyltransferase [Brevibacillus sp.]
MIQKRAVEKTDEAFLLQLYISTRADELAAWGWDKQMQEQFLQLQFLAQKNSYSTQYPDAEHLLIFSENIPAGRIMIARTETKITLVDISLLPHHRNKGIGCTLIRELQQEAADTSRPLHLSVLPTNRAIHLYERLGFQTIDSSGFHISMEWTPTSSDEGPSI